MTEVHIIWALTGLEDFSSMIDPAFQDVAGNLVCDSVSTIHDGAAADANVRRAIALKERVDGLRRAETRATDARAAARQIVDHERRISVLCPTESGKIRRPEMTN